MKPDPRFLLLLACFSLSGFAGLIYETAWTQQLALVFGTSELALATVLAAYMAGLALGAAAAGRLVSRVRRPILAYAVLELGIGAAALLVPSAIGLAGRLHVALFGGGELPPEAGSPASGLFTFASSFAILVVPTALMGATLPLLARHAVRREAEIGRRIGALYTANVAGAAAGTLAAAFLLLPRIGLGRTVLAGATINLAVFGLAAMLGRGAGGEITAGEPDPPAAGAAGGRWVLPLISISGAVSLTWEVLWTRLLGQVLGGSVYAFATMLATFLVGLALGSALAGGLASGHERARGAFAAAQVAVAALSLAAFAAAGRLPELARAVAASERLLTAGATLGAVTLLPGAIAIGATFPLAVRCLATGAGDAARASARVFAWNTVGAIAGALAAGYLVLPALRFAGTAAAAAATSLLLAVAAALAVPPRRTMPAAAALAGLALLTALPPATPETALRHGALGHQATPGKMVFYAVGRSATVQLFDQRAGWRLTTNGLPESMIEPPWGRPGGAVAAHWLSLLALAARPDARSLLVVGLGGGVTVEEVPSTIAEIHVVELEPEVIRANRAVAARRRSDPLSDPRLELHTGDARGVLRLTGRRFDAVVSQPSHPWTSGASHLFTRELFALVRERLTPGGVFVQWMGLPFVDEALLRSLLATAAAVFPHVEVYQPDPGAILLLASAEPLDVASTADRALALAPELWARLGVLCREDVAAARALDDAGVRRLAAGARPSTDAFNLFQTRSPRVLGHPLGNTGLYRLLAPYEPLLSAPAGLDHVYLARRLIRQGAVERARRLGEALPDGVARRTMAGLAALAAGEESSGELALREALALDPAAEEALDALLAARYRPAILRGEAAAFAERFTGDPAAAVIAGWRSLGAADWRGIRLLEERLATVAVRHPLFAEARRLRAEWRIAGGDPARAREALELIEPLLAPQPATADLLLRARAAAAAGDAAAALAALDEALPRLPRGSDPAQEAARILRSLPPAAAIDWRRELDERLRRPPRAMADPGAYY